MSTTAETRVTERTRWEFDPAHTLVEFGVKHMMFTTVKGRFTDVRGTIVADDHEPALSAVAVEIEAGSIDTREEKRDAHLRSADFLDAESYPALTFQSTRVEDLGDGRLRVVGDLTIRGTTREVGLDATYNGRGKSPWGQEVASFSARTAINRRDFDLVWNVALETGGVLVGDKIDITLEVEAIKQE